MDAEAQAKLLDRIAAGLCVGGGVVTCNGGATEQRLVAFLVILRDEPRLVWLAARLCTLHA